ncbi:MAG: hypothetical protein WCI27_05200 [Candidatus Omnitrophota bacterium]
MRARHGMVFLVAGLVIYPILIAFGGDGQLPLSGQRPEIKIYIDELLAGEIISVEHTTDGMEESKKRLPADPKGFSAGRYKVVFNGKDEKKAMIFQTEERVGHMSPVIPGQTDIGGYVEILRDPESDQNAAYFTARDAGLRKGLNSIKDLKLNTSELDYLIRMLYKKFGTFLSDSQAMNLNDVKDYALAIQFSDKNGMIEYHHNLVRALPLLNDAD